MALALNIGKCSLLGNYRENNEDSIEVKQFPDLIVSIVADGMGGQAAGEIASKRAIEIIPRELRKSLTAQLNVEGVKGAMKRAIVQANEEILQMAALERDLPLVGLVLVDAVTPDVLSLPGGPPVVHAFGRLLQVVSHGARLGLMHPVSLVSGNLIGLPGEPGAEKRRIHASATHAHGAAAEVMSWPATSKLAGAADLPQELPVAVVTAGPARPGGQLKPLQEAPAKRARSGYIEHVAAANHANLLGPRFADAILRGIDHVLGLKG